MNPLSRTTGNSMQPDHPEPRWSRPSLFGHRTRTRTATTASWTTGPRTTRRTMPHGTGALDAEVGELMNCEDGNPSTLQIVEWNQYPVEYHNRLQTPLFLP